MIKQIAILFLLFVPIVSWAGDACTNPNEYTIDKRCYVTEMQKQQKPYNAVGYVVSKDGRVSGSGTIVKRQGVTKDDVGYFLYTAKHCTDKDGDKVSDDILKIRLPSGQEFDTKLVQQGVFDLGGIGGKEGDWAKYRVLPIDQNSNADVEKDLNGAWVRINDSFLRGAKNVRIIGYGALKIMSDQEIQDFQKDYANFIEDFHVNDVHTEDGGVYGAGVTMFVMYNRGRFEDDALKVSECSQNSNSQFTGCQGWSGNSGGGAFDDNGNLMWIVTLGNYQIGGKDHANITGGVNFMPFGRLSDRQK